MTRHRLMQYGSVAVLGALVGACASAATVYGVAVWWRKGVKA